MMHSQMIPSPLEKQEQVEGPSGIVLSTVAWGTPTAPYHLLCVHGGYQAKECYREQFEALALADCYLVGFDLPWHGRSGPLPGESNLVPSLHILAESITAVRKHYSMSDATVILAWSLGGLIVRQYLQNTPPIGGLILVAPLLDMHEGMAAWQEYSPHTLAIVLSLEQYQNFSDRGLSFVRFVEMLSESPPDYFTMGYNSLSFIKAGAHLSDMLARPQAGNVEAFLSGLSCPVLFIQGTKDQLLPAKYTRSNVARIPKGQVKLVELPCGHSPHLEMPLVFNAAVLEFLLSRRAHRGIGALMHPGGHEQ